MSTDPKGKRLLYIINHMDWFWSHRLPLAKSAQQDGWDVYVAAHDATKDANLKAEGFHGLELPMIGGALGVLSGVFAVRCLIRELQPDLVHAITLKYAFITGLAVRFCKGTRAVYTVAGLGYLFSGETLKARMLRLLVGPFLKLALNHKRVQVIVQNPDDRARLFKHGFVEAERCHLIRGSGVDTNMFTFTPEPDTQEPLVIMPTRLVHDKGLSVFVETARLLKQQGVRARFVIAGGLSASNPRAMKREEIEALVADGAAEWLGRVDDMPALYARSALVLYPSWYGEGVPKVLLEAAATGRAIVTTDHPGCREAVADGVNGLLVPVKDVQATATAVRSLLDDPALRTQMGQESRKRAEKEFGVSLINKKTLAVYTQACA